MVVVSMEWAHSFRRRLYLIIPGAAPETEYARVRTDVSECTAINIYRVRRANVRPLKSRVWFAR